MQMLVVFESMYGNTHDIAEHVAQGLRAAGEARVVPVTDATDAALAGVDAVVVGGPTHVHGMATERTHQAAREAAEKPGSEITMDPDAEGPTLRAWFDGVTLPSGCRAAAFDTRMHGPAALTGRASRGIGKRLEGHGASMIAPAESFFVDKHNHLSEGEAARAEEWGASLARALSAGGAEPA